MKTNFLKVFLLFFIFSFMFCNFVSLNNNIVFAEEKQIFYYAKIEKSNVGFYDKPINEETSLLFILPQTYFVKLTANSENENFYCATYLDLSGYVNKADVTVVKGIPKQPFCDTLFVRIFIPSGLALRSSPDSSKPFNVLLTVPFMETNLIYYGSKTGEEAITKKGKEWHYCKYIFSEGFERGYLYSVFCDSLDDITPNTEIFEPITEELFVVEKSIEPTSNITSNNSYLNDEFKIVIVIVICLPCLLIIYLLFKPTKLVVDNGNTKKQKIHKLRKSEFYEYEE